MKEPGTRGLIANRTMWLGVAAAAMALGIAGCGDDGDSSSTAAQNTASTTAAGGGEAVRISETDFALDRSDVSVQAGEVTFDVTNDGGTTHNFEIEGPGLEQDLPSDLAPGDSGQLTVELKAGETYEMYCPIDGHADMGMEGEITVEG